MLPPGEPRLYHFDAAKFDLTALLAIQNVNTKPLFQALCWGETHDPVHYNFNNLMKLQNEGPLIFLVSASNHFMF